MTESKLLKYRFIVYRFETIEESTAKQLSIVGRCQ